MAVILTVSVAGSIFAVSGCDSKEQTETKETTEVEALSSEEDNEDIEADKSSDPETDETYVPAAVYADTEDFKCQTIKDFIDENKDNPNIIMESKLGDNAGSFDNTAVGVEEVLIASDFKEKLKTMFIKFDTVDNAKDYLGDELIGQKLVITENADGSIDYETEGDANKMYGKIYTDGLMTWVMKIS